MTKRLFFIALLAAFSQSVIAQSESEKARLTGKEITDLMVQASRMPAQQQNSRLDQILKDQAGSRTPRSDFTFCSGLAYLGNFKAQMCVGKAFETGSGIVEDTSEAYTWYAVASENRTADKAEIQQAESERDRLQLKLVAAYPHPTEDDLADMINSLKGRIAQYQEQIKKAKN